MTHDESFPLTELQQGYWVGQLGHLEVSCRAQRYLEISAPDVDLPRFERALQRLFDRHELLRSVVRDDGAWHLLPEVPPFRIEVVDLRGRSPEEVEQTLAATGDEMMKDGPRPDQWPLLRVRAHLLDDGTTRLHVVASLIALDFGAWRVFNREWEMLYNDPDAELPPIGRYSDFVRALNAQSEKPEYQAALKHVLDRLTGRARAPELPLHRLPSNDSAGHWRHYTTNIAPELWASFQDLAHRNGILPTVALQTIYAEMIAGWSRTSNFVVTTLVDNRRKELHPDYDRLLGNTGSTMLVDTTVEGSSYLEHARSCLEGWFDAARHRQVSGIRVGRELNRIYRSGTAPLFPVVFTSPLGKENRSHLRWIGKEVEQRMQTPQVWLDCQIFNEEDYLVVNLDAAEDLYPQGVLKNMYECLVDRLQELAGSDAAWHGGYTIAPRRQLEQRAEVNNTAAPLSDATLDGLFEESAARRPDHPAVIAGSGDTLTYGQLRSRVHTLSAQVAELDPRRDKRVAVVMEKGWEPIAAVLAILEAGGTYLPVNPDHTPADRLARLLADGDVELALTQSSLDSRLTWPDGVRRLSVDTVDWSDAKAPPSVPERSATDLAYIIYTSGSSGTPKGVMIDHGGAVNTILDINRRFRIGPEDRVLAISSLSFDLSVYDVFGTLAAGGTIVMPAAEQAHDPAQWARLLVDAGVTVWNSAPQLMELLVDYAAAIPDLVPRDLRLAMLSGDWIPVKLPDRLRALVPDIEFVSLGGATEASIWSVFYPVSSVEPGWRSIPYGKPLTNQTLHIFDDALRARPVWVPGDLYIGGRGVALGYWKDEAKTAKSFIQHPETGERLYRTGDLGRYLPDGNIEFLGRKDSQVKISGYRVELGEIEAAINAHAGIKESYLLVRGGNQPGWRPGDTSEPTGAGRPEQRQIVAYYIEEPGAEVDVEQLRVELGSKLPGYMVPSFFIRLDSIPLSPNGKVDRRALPMPSSPSAHGTEQAEEVETEPRNELERQVHAIWMQALSVEAIGIHDDFFDLGGTSLSAARVAARVAEVLNETIPISILMESRTIAELAAVLRERREGEASSHSPLTRIRAGRGQPLFMVHPVGGGTLCYHDLASYVQPGCPMYGLDASALADELPGIARLEDLAARYLAEIRTVQPRGPYLLAGWSLGGIVAYEMACQLERVGEKAAFLCLIDSFVPRPAEGDAPPPADLRRWFNADLEGTGGQAEGSAAGTALDRMFSVFRENSRLSRAYAPSQTVDTALLVRAADGARPEFRHHPALRNPALDDEFMGWGEWIKRPVVRAVPGDHYTIMRPPNVQRLGAALSSGLAEQVRTKEEDAVSG